MEELGRAFLLTVAFLVALFLATLLLLLPTFLAPTLVAAFLDSLAAEVAAFGRGFLAVGVFDVDFFTVAVAAVLDLAAFVFFAAGCSTLCFAPRFLLESKEKNPLLYPIRVKLELERSRQKL